MKTRWASGLTLVCAVLLAGCVADGAAGESATTSTASPSPDTSADVREDLRSIARDASEDLGGRVGIAVADAEGVVQVGLSGDSWAWSTIKVPVAVAADRAEVATDGLIAASISSSDNVAAYQLSLAIDGDLGDLPHVPDLAPLPGETRWPLTQQAKFAAELRCLDDAGTTWEAMGDIVDWQDHGLGRIPGAHFKGGWGLDTDRVYTVRQIATVPVDEGYIGVAVITHPDDADHDTAVDILDDVGRRLAGLARDGRLGIPVTCGR